MIPEQLQKPEFRFIKIKRKSKVPIEQDWQNKKNYSFDNATLLKHSEKANIGIVGGYADLAFLDCDDKKIKQIAEERLSETFTVKTGREEGAHKYYQISDWQGTRLILRKSENDYGDLRGKGHQVLIPNSIHPSGKKYKIEKNVTIAQISIKEFKEVFEEFLDWKEETSKANKVKLVSNKDKSLIEKVLANKKDIKLQVLLKGEHKEYYSSRSEAEQALLCKLVSYSLNKEQIYEIMQRYSKIGKWQEAPEQYKEMSYQKAVNRIKKKQNKEEKILCNDKEALEILKNPKLFDLITKEIEKKVEKEEDAIQTIFLVSCVTFVENAKAESSNLLVNAESGAGKDWVTKNTLGIWSRQKYFHRTRITPTAFTYWHNSEFEPEWTWSGKIFYNEDISNSVLNCDVFKTMASGGTKSTVTVNQRAVDVEINGKPAMIITTASANPKKETLRRFPVVNLNETVDQTKAIIEKQCEEAATGEDQEYNEKITKALDCLKKVKVIIPFAKMLPKHMPTKHVIMRTHSNRFLDYIKASAALHQFQRKTDSKSSVVAEEQDYSVAKKVLEKITSNPLMIPLTKDQQKILELFRNNSETKYSVKEIEPHFAFTDKWLRKLLDHLFDYGFLEKDRDLREGSDKKVIVYSFKEQLEVKLPCWEELTNKNKNSTIASNSSNSKSSSIPPNTKKELKQLNKLYSKQETQEEVTTPKVELL